jgi:hypothetical protein
MWLLRRKTVDTKAGGEVLPPSAGPMRRIEITVERHWVTRLVRGGDAGPVVKEAAGMEVGPVLPAPPDG